MLRRLPFLVVVSALAAWGQNAVSAHSGMIHYVEGKVSLNGQDVQPKFGEFPEVKDGMTLATEDGRAEVLLTPGVFLRLSEGSSFRMISNRLTDTQFEVLSGSAVIEVDELLKDNSITVQHKGASIVLNKRGLYRIDADLDRLRVFEGEARVTSGGDTTVARKGREVQVGAVLSARNFDTKSTDAFDRWSARRGEYIATANVSSAQSAGTSGNYSCFVANNCTRGSGQWVWNPWYGMITYVPYDGFGYSPYGYMYFSPQTVYYVTNPAAAGLNRGGLTPMPSAASASPLGSSTINSSIRNDVGSMSPVDSGMRSGGAPSGGVGGGSMGGGVSAAPAAAAPSAGGGRAR